ncbi:MAG: VTT domain-containing protein [Methanomicrobiales archaeon]|nr:VTT domain-containing protein [Methanomicrobiales archaeon]
MILGFLDFLLHIDTYLGPLVQTYGFWIYLILFLIIFIETGLVVTPFLPGDSLLFVAGTLAGAGLLDIITLCATLSIAAIAGDSLNYWIGKSSRLERLECRYPRIFKKEYFETTNRFFEKYGAKTIVIARFVPYIRCFAPFLAGVGRMNYSRFLSYNILGGIAWVISFLALGYFFGGIPIVQENFELVVLAIIIISLIAVASIFLGVVRFATAKDQCPVDGTPGEQKGEAEK